MNIRSLTSRATAFLGGVIATLALLEVLLRLMPVLDGAYAADSSRKWPAHTLIANSNYTYSMGWNFRNVHHGHINNLGYVAPFDYQKGAGGIVVIGDSYVESMMNAYDETLQGALAHDLRFPQQVMNFGMSGADLSHYLGTAELVGRRFTPSWAVVVITASDYRGGFSAAPGFYRWAPERDPPVQLVPDLQRSPLTKLLRSLALVRYIRGNLMISTRDLIHLHWAHDTDDELDCAHRTLPPADEQLTAKFIAALPRALGLPAERVILVFDSDRQALYAGTSAAAKTCPDVDELARARLMQLAATHGVRVIDSGPIFRKYYTSTHQRVDYLPQDGHWNAAGHELIARAVAGMINDTSPSTRFTFVPSSARVAHEE